MVVYRVASGGETARSCVVAKHVAVATHTKEMNTSVYLTLISKVVKDRLMRCWWGGQGCTQHTHTQDE